MAFSLRLRLHYKAARVGNVRVRVNIDQILSQASDYDLDYDAAVSFAKSQGQSLVEFVNHFAVTLATGYRDQRYDFGFCDGAANWLFGFMTDKTFLSSNDNTLPSPAFDVYLAFDEGEYHHRGDPEGVIAEEKYTRPLIEQILSGHSCPNNANHGDR